MQQSGTQRLSGLCLITDHLYLSNSRAANDGDVVPRYNLTCIINATEKSRDRDAVPPGVDYLHVPVADHPLTPLDAHFDRVADKIQMVAEHSGGGDGGGHTLVYCNAGVSRSATLCMAYLMKHRAMSLLEAHSWVKARRPIVRPNAGFWRQLVQYELSLRGNNTVRMVASSIGEIPDIYEEEAKHMI